MGKIPSITWESIPALLGLQSAAVTAITAPFWPLDHTSIPQPPLNEQQKYIYIYVQKNI
jgi:hypothetical protein